MEDTRRSAIAASVPPSSTTSDDERTTTTPAIGPNQHQNIDSAASAELTTTSWMAGPWRLRRYNADEMLHQFYTSRIPRPTITSTGQLVATPIAPSCYLSEAEEDAIFYSGTANITTTPAAELFVTPTDPCCTLSEAEVTEIFRFGKKNTTPTHAATLTTGHPATTALAIPHILEIIICNLPPFDIQEARKVSRIWRATIKGSKGLPSVRTLHPATTSDDSWKCSNTVRGVSWPAIGRTCCVPCYDTPQMKLHPQLDTIDVEKLPPGTKTFNLTEDRHCDPQRPESWDFRNYLNRHHEDFVTSPRCTAVVLKMSKFRDPISNRITFEHCTVYVPTGVKIRHLLEVVRSLEQQMRNRGALRLKVVGQVAVVDDASSIVPRSTASMKHQSSTAVAASLHPFTHRLPRTKRKLAGYPMYTTLDAYGVDGPKRSKLRSDASNAVHRFARSASDQEAVGINMKRTSDSVASKASKTSAQLSVGSILDSSDLGTVWPSFWSSSTELPIVPSAYPALSSAIDRAIVGSAARTALDPTGSGAAQSSTTLHRDGQIVHTERNIKVDSINARTASATDNVAQTSTTTTAQSLFGSGLEAGSMVTTAVTKVGSAQSTRSSRLLPVPNTPRPAALTSPSSYTASTRAPMTLDEIEELIEIATLGAAAAATAEQCRPVVIDRNTIALSDQGFAIPHILKGILCNLSPYDIQAARKVCYLWRGTIFRSKQLRPLRALTPTAITIGDDPRSWFNHIHWRQSELWRWDHGIGSTCCVPCYPFAKLILHPKLQTVHIPELPAEVITFELAKDRRDQQPSNAVSHGIFGASLLPFRKDFITSPRCSAVVLKICTLEQRRPPRTFEHCTVYVRTGITIGDLLIVVRKLERQIHNRGSFTLVLRGQLAVIEPNREPGFKQRAIDKCDVVLERVYWFLVWFVEEAWTRVITFVGRVFWLMVWLLVEMLRLIGWLLGGMWQIIVWSIGGAWRIVMWLLKMLWWSREWVPWVLFCVLGSHFCKLVFMSWVQTRRGE